MEPSGIEYDVIVVGAGPAGCAAATLLGRRGRRVLLLDRARFPRTKLCTHAIMPAGLPVLADLGVLDEVEAAGAQRWCGVRLWLNGADFVASLPHRRVAFPYGLSLRRDALDPILLTAARRQPGVDVWTSAEVASLLRDRSGVCGVRLFASGRAACGAAEPGEGDATTGEVRARQIILAGGRLSGLARGAGLRALVWPNRHTAYVAYLAGIPAEAEPALEGYYLYGQGASLLPADGGLRVGGVMAPPGSWPPGEWAARLLHELRRFPTLRPRLRDARVVSHPVAVRGLRNVWREAEAPGLLLIGDAGVQTDPLFGQGIAWALRSGAWAAEVVDLRLRSAVAGPAAPGYAGRRVATFGPRFAAMSALSAVTPGSRLERLIVANAVANPASTRLFLRLILGFATVTRSAPPRRSVATWVREALRG